MLIGAVTNLVPWSGLGTTGLSRATADAAAVADSAVPASTATAAAATSVTLGQGLAGVDALVYAAPARVSVVAPVWEQRSNDAVSELMARNDAYRSLGSRFFGLGAAMLERFGAEATGDYSQAVVRLAADTPAADIPALAAAMQSDLHLQADNRITLEIKTASGATVRVSLGSQDEGLAVKLEISGGEPTDAERDALNQLAGAFQDAIDGLAGKPPKLALGGLMQFDTSVLSSVDFHASILLDGKNTQTVDFHADGETRSVSASGPAGTVKVDVDLANSAILGNARQQAQALDRYLLQFDAAVTRGKGDASLMALFKDAFSQMHRSDGASAASTGRDASAMLMLNEADHSLLSGLADFSASIVQVPQAVNPMRPDEMDTFSYKASQSTSVIGSDPRDRTIRQEQASTLSASYHKALSPELTLMLTQAKESQYYFFDQIEDSARSSTEIAYRDGVVASAAITQSAQRSTQTQKYMMGRLEADTTSGADVSRTWDLRELLRSLEKATLSRDPAALRDRAQTLAGLEGLGVLQADPGALQLKSAPVPG